MDDDRGSSDRHGASSFHVEEWRGSSSSKLTRTAVLTANSSSLLLRRSGSRWVELRRKIVEAFIPEGFPDSVTRDYLPFQLWDLLQGLSTYIRAMLSTQALLSAIGVGEKSATVLGATFQIALAVVPLTTHARVVTDYQAIQGMLGGIVFTFYQGSNLDSHAKMWRLIADFMNDIGMLMDLISPLCPSALIPIVCLGSLSRSFTGVASGATRAALTQHFSLQNNAADISAKEGSQETVATMAGMALGMLLAHITRGKHLSIWFSFLSLTLFHMFANYMAVRCLSLTTMNDERSWLLLRHFMKTGEVMFPKQVSDMEHVFPIWLSSKTSPSDILHKRVSLGTKVSSLNHSDAMELSRLSTSHYKGEKYLLLEKKGQIQVFIHRQSTQEDVLKSFIHALVLADFSRGRTSSHVESCDWMSKYFSVFIKKLQQAGWTTERLLCHSIVWRADWVVDTSDVKVE